MIAGGHSLDDISEYSFLQFMAFTKIAERQEAIRRAAFVSDLSAVVASMFSGGKEAPVVGLLASLNDVIQEGKTNGNERDQQP